MKRALLTLLFLPICLALFASTQVQPITIHFDYIAGTGGGGFCGLEGDGVHCEASNSGAVVNSNSSDEWPSPDCATIDYSGPVYRFPSPAGPYCGSVDNEGTGAATFPVPAGVAVTDPQGNLLGATNSGGTVVVTTVQSGRYTRLQSIHFNNVTFTPGAAPVSAPAPSSSVSPSKESTESCASRKDYQSHKDLHTSGLPDTPGPPDVMFGLPSESDLVIDKVLNCTGEDYRKQPCWMEKI